MLPSIISIAVNFIKQIPNPRLGGPLLPKPPWHDEWDAEDAELGPAPVERPAPVPVEAVTPAPIPPQFRGNPAGLPPRGDLCAGRR